MYMTKTKSVGDRAANRHSGHSKAGLSADGWKLNSCHTDAEIDKFCLSCSDCRLEHSTRWFQVFNETYSLHSDYYLYISNEEIKGACPMTLIKGPLSRDPRAISMPYLAAAGVLSTDAGDQSVMEIDLVKDMNKVGKYKSIEFRALDPKAESKFLISKLPLEGFSSGSTRPFSSNLRRKINKAKKEGYLVSFGKFKIDETYPLYLETMKRHGLPPHSPAFFANIEKSFSDAFQLLTLESGSEVVACMVLIGFGDTLYAPFIYGLKAHQKRLANYLLYWEAINFGSLQGFETVDFGRSIVSSGNQRYKKQWGCVEVPVASRNYIHGELDNNSPTQRYVTSRTLQIFSNLWGLSPIQVQKALGPRLRKFII